MRELASRGVASTGSNPPERINKRTADNLRARQVHAPFDKTARGTKEVRKVDRKEQMMNQEVEIFQHGEFGSVRVVEENGECYFVAADVCKALELTNPTVALENLDADEKAKFNLGLRGGDTNERAKYDIRLEGFY